MIDFSIFSDYTFQIVALGSCLLGIISAIVGTYSVIKKEALIGDAVSHCALLGLSLAFLFTGTKKTEVLLLGAAISGTVGVVLVNKITQYSKVKFDAALAVVLSCMFGMGVVALNYIQRVGGSNQAGLSKFIYGQASTLLKRDIYFMIVVGIILFVFIILFWKEFKIVTFDPEFATIQGYKSHKVKMLLSLLTVLAIVIGLQSVGVILMVSLLISPAVVARQWSDNLLHIMIIAGIIGGISGILGTAYSSSITNMPTGPMIIAIMSGFVLFSLIFAPNKGMIAILFKRKKQRANILKSIDKEVL